MNMVLGTHLRIQADRHKNILNFYAIALTQKTHHIKVSSFDDFRLLVKSLLDTQLVYHNPLYLCDTPGNAPKYAINILYNELSSLTHRDITHSDELLHDFFINNLFGDIIFIEETNTVSTRPWYQKLIKAIEANTMYAKIPIIIASEGR